ncbi:MAG: cytochrome o ubiquinol oxidase subunit I, partial [Pseudomonadota bacterium]
AGYERKTDGYTPIHMPHYTATGIVISGLWTVMGFALVWHVWWLAAAAAVASLVYGIAHTFNYNRDYYVPIDEIEQIEGARTQQEAAYKQVAAAQ